MINAETTVFDMQFSLLLDKPDVVAAIFVSNSSVNTFCITLVFVTYLFVVGNVVVH